MGYSLFENTAGFAAELLFVETTYMNRRQDLTAEKKRKNRETRLSGILRNCIICRNNSLGASTARPDVPTGRGGISYDVTIAVPGPQ